VEQPRYNLFQRRRVEIELAPICKELGIGLTTFSPLAYGLLSGKYNDGIPANSRAASTDMAWIRDSITPEKVAKVRQLTALAQTLDLTTAQLAIAWLLRRKEISSVITGATRVEQLDENLAAGDAEDKLTDDVLERIEKIAGNMPE
jgi:aryl-alcohol dehydrogenase-like predicted oxidoreductase